MLAYNSLPEPQATGPSAAGQPQSAPWPHVEFVIALQELGGDDARAALMGIRASAKNEKLVRLVDQALEYMRREAERAEEAEGRERSIPGH